MPSDTMAPAATLPIHIEGRRWFERTNGNTYHTVRIFQDGQQIAYLPFQYGYGQQWFWTAVEWLKNNGYIPTDEQYPSDYLRKHVHASESVIDVARKKDL